MTKDAKDEEMICALTADEHDALRTGLRGLPDTMPPRAVWHRIREQAEAEGLITRPAARRPSTWYVGGSLAAAIVVAVLIVPGIFEEEPVVYPTTPDNVGSSSPIQLNTLQTLMTESRELENDLRDLPDKPRVMRAGTAATIADLEDRIAAIDYQLNDPEFQLTPEEEEIFWRERVRLMKLLVGMRYAQAQRTAF
ncbi:MAG: hypothetical protein GWP60_08470 [Gammaproteobacteria bacterium]|jgi:hypothetical protein|nr:hypothetical protein [Gammaproteobacteria bacterium]